MRGELPVQSMEGIELLAPAEWGMDRDPGGAAQQRFFSAFHAAVEQQTGVLLPQPGVSALLLSAWHG